MKIGITMYETSFPTSDTSVKVPSYGSYPLTDALIYNRVTPVLLPSVVPNPTVIKELAGKISGMILGGGDDIDPATYGEVALGPDLTYPQRDRFETAMVHEMLRERKPVLGICRGCQMLNVTLGGTLYQNIYRQLDPNRLLDHETGTHWVKISPQSRLFKVLGQQQLVNSRHHQAVKRLGRHLRVVARAGDGIVEGIENQDALIQGVQWHPENLWRTDSAQNRLFRNFFKRVRQASHDYGTL